MSKNGWKSGEDPTVRALRSLAAVVFIVSIPMMLILDRADPAVVSAVIVGLLLLLGIVEGVVRLPNYLASSKAPKESDMDFLASSVPPKEDEEEEDGH